MLAFFISFSSPSFVFHVRTFVVYGYREAVIIVVLLAINSSSFSIFPFTAGLMPRSLERNSCRRFPGSHKCWRAAIARSSNLRLYAPDCHTESLDTDLTFTHYPHGPMHYRCTLSFTCFSARFGLCAMPSLNVHSALQSCGSACRLSLVFLFFFVCF